MKDYLEHLRAKPEHVRRTIALSASLAVAAVVAVGWMIALMSSGKLALAPIQPDEESTAVINETRERFDDLAGAAGAFYGNKQQPAVTVIPDEKPVEAVPPEEDTVLHF